MGSNADKLQWRRKMNEDEWLNYALLWEAIKDRLLTNEEFELYRQYNDMRAEYFNEILIKLDEDTGIQHDILYFYIDLNEDPENQVAIKFTEKERDIGREENVGCIRMSISSLTNRDKVDNAFATAELYRQNDVQCMLKVK